MSAFAALAAANAEEVATLRSDIADLQKANENLRLQLAALAERHEALRSAAEEVVDRWSEGDLAEAVRFLESSIDEDLLAELGKVQEVPHG